MGRLYHWTMGSLPEQPRERGSDRLALCIGLVAAFAMLLGARHKLGKAYFLADTWSLAVYGVVPMVLVAWWAVRRRWAVVLGTLIGLVPILATVIHGLWADAVRSDPRLLLGPCILALVLLLVGAADREKWGVSLGDWRWWGPRVGVALLVICVGSLVALWLSPELRSVYPLANSARSSFTGLLVFQAMLGAYLLGWEFFFRGFLLFGLSRRGDVILALLVQAFPFFLLHMRKPELEMALSFVGALVIGRFCLRARTFLPALILHWGMNFTVSALAFLWRL